MSFGDVLGSIAGAVTSGLFSARQAGKQRAYQTYMSNTAHQREAADLEAAGLNRILSATGSGASTPGGAMAQTPDFAGAINTGRLVSAQVKNTNADTKKKESETALAEAQRTAIVGGIHQTAAQTRETQQRVDRGEAGRRYWDAEAQAGYETAVANAIRAGKDAGQSGVALQRAEKEFQKILDDPELLEWMMSKDRALTRQIQEAIRGDADAGEIVRMLLQVIGR